MKRPRSVQRVIGPSIAYVPLTKGMFALIESEDIDKASQCCWYAHTTIISGKEQRYAYRARNKQFPRAVALHRFLMGEPVEFIDHRNRNGLDCRKNANLRPANQSENQCNTGIRSDSKTGFKGVQWYPREKRFVAKIRKNGKRICLGYFRTVEQAAESYQKAAKELHGEFARFE